MPTLEPGAALRDHAVVVNASELLVLVPEGMNRVDPMMFFASPGPFELEIGSGKGGFLLSRARNHPEIRILGIEFKNKLSLYCADRLARWGIENARVMRTDARYLVMHQLPPESVTVLHLYHPDPWPKKRHHKRRLMKPDFVDAAVRLLVPGGRWRIQSDHEEYFAEMVGLVDAHAGVHRIPWEESAAEPGPEWQGTNFELKFQQRGHPILRAAYQRR